MVVVPVAENLRGRLRRQGGCFYSGGHGDGGRVRDDGAGAHRRGAEDGGCGRRLQAGDGGVDGAPSSQTEGVGAARGGTR